MLMTMERWSLGFTMERERLFLLLALNLPLLVCLSHRIGFERTATWRESARDAIVAYGMGVVASALILVLLTGVWAQWTAVIGTPRDQASTVTRPIGLEQQARM